MFGIKNHDLHLGLGFGYTRHASVRVFPACWPMSRAMSWCRSLERENLGHSFTLLRFATNTLSRSSRKHQSGLGRVPHHCWWHPKTIRIRSLFLKFSAHACSERACDARRRWRRARWARWCLAGAAMPLPECRRPLVLSPKCLALSVPLLAILSSPEARRPRKLHAGSCTRRLPL